MSPAKRELLQARLRSHVHQSGLEGFASYVKQLERLPSDDPEWQTFVNLLTTNKTEFFREKGHFDYLERTFMPSWMKSKNQDLRVWCAAASTGEEPYTLSMSLGRSLQPGKRVEILATDIDTDVLEKAKRAVYRKEILQQIPPELREAVVSRGTEEIAHWVRIRREVKDRVIFAQHNLILPDPPRRDFDLIFCRNVLIYFSPATIEKVAKKLYEAAKPGALLFIGHSESLQNLKHPWTYVSPSIYRKKAGL